MLVAAMRRRAQFLAAPSSYISYEMLSLHITDADAVVPLLGYQRELTYQRDDGSFSAFGNRDPSGSIW